ncbi:hypothetical protein CHARACLAT_027586, partial [Characodon lateralis]|nr:hypothetical protein [Characodon lateralis]
MLLNPNSTNPLPHRGTPPQVNSIAEKPMKPHPHSASSTQSTPAAPRSPTTQRAATPRQGPRATSPPPTGATGQTPASTTPTTGPPTLHHERTNSPTKRSPASSRHPGPLSPTTPPLSHKKTLHQCHCNDHPGGNTIQLSSTIAAQPIQMPVTPHPRRHDNQQSSTPPSPPNPPRHRQQFQHTSPQEGYMHQPGTSGQPLQAKHNQPAAPVQSQDMLRHPTHPTANPAWHPTMGYNHRRKEWKKATAAPVTGCPANSTLIPQGTPACRPPAPLHGAPRPTRAGPARHPSGATFQSTPSKTPYRSLAPPQPADQGPKPGAEIQGNPSDPERAKTLAPDKTRPPTPAQTRLEGPLPLPASDHRWEMANGGVKRPQACLRQLKCGVDACCCSVHLKRKNGGEESLLVQCTEWTCTKRRMLAGIITDYTFGLGYMLLAGVAYLIRDWRKLQLAISAPGFLLIFYIRVLPQSARWLLANDRTEEAIALLRKAALVNGRVLPPAVQTEKWEFFGGSKRSHSAMDLVRTPQMRKRAIILFYIWFVNVLVYYGLSLGVSRLGTDLYLTQFVFGLVEIPARTVVLIVLPFTRRFTLSGFLAIGGLACLLMLAVPA